MKSENHGNFVYLFYQIGSKKNITDVEQFLREQKNTSYKPTMINSIDSSISIEDDTDATYGYLGYEVYNTTTLTRITTKILPLPAERLRLISTEDWVDFNQYMTHYWRNESIAASVCPEKCIFFILNCMKNTIEVRDLYKNEVLDTWTCNPKIFCFEFDQKTSKLIAACGFGNIFVANFCMKEKKFVGSTKTIRGIHSDLALKIFVNPFREEKDTVYIGLMFNNKIYKLNFVNEDLEKINYDYDRNWTLVLKNCGFIQGKHYIPNFRVGKMSILCPGQDDW